jgi:hypothetical protein
MPVSLRNLRVLETPRTGIAKKERQLRNFPYCSKKPIRKLRQRTWLKSMEPGTNRFAVSKIGYQNKEVSVNVASGERNQLTV